MKNRIRRLEVATGLGDDAPPPRAVLVLPFCGSFEDAESGEMLPPEPNQPGAVLQIVDGDRVAALVAEGMDGEEAIWRAATEFGRPKQPRTAEDNP